MQLPSHGIMHVTNAAMVGTTTRLLLSPQSIHHPQTLRVSQGPPPAAANC